jgi:very-short-patch-repair endonuclease
MIVYRKKLQPLASKLRAGMTDAELRLWDRLRMRQLLGFQFYRQRIIGNHIVDFYCPIAKLVIEVDGAHHAEPKMIEDDKKRDDYLKKQGLAVLRFTDTDVLLNTDAVAEAILARLETGENPS